MVWPRFFDIKLSFSAVAAYWCYIYHSGIRVNKVLSQVLVAISCEYV